MAKQRKNFTTDSMDDFNTESFYYGEKTEMCPAEMGTNGPETRNGKVANSLFVKVRKEPSFESEVIKVLGRGDKVNIVDVVDKFYKISIDEDSVAYISSDFVEEE